MTRVCTEPFHASLETRIVACIWMRFVLLDFLLRGGRGGGVWEGFMIAIVSRYVKLFVVLISSFRKEQPLYLLRLWDGVFSVML